MDELITYCRRTNRHERYALHIRLENNLHYINKRGPLLTAGCLADLTDGEQIAEGKPTKRERKRERETCVKRVQLREWIW
jgi:hypothetical protein